MQYEHEAELAANIVVAALQSGKLEGRAKDVATYYATIFEQIICSDKPEKEIVECISSLMSLSKLI